MSFGPNILHLLTDKALYVVPKMSSTSIMQAVAKSIWGKRAWLKKVLTLAVALAVAAAVIHIFEEFSTFSLTILASPHILSFHAIAQWLADDAVQSRVRR